MIVNEIKELLTKEYVGRALQVIEYPDTRLQEVSKIVYPIANNVQLDQLIKDMVATVQAERALGLAAIQVGVPLRVMVLQNKTGVRVLINPVLEQSTGKTYVDEGCLSLPRLFVKVPRAESVSVSYMDSDGLKQLVNLTDFEARAFQHELDHLNGLTMLDKLSDFRRKETLTKWKKLRV
jgi:peptide deformylase